MPADGPQTLILRSGATMPNSRLPVLVYRQALPTQSADFAALFAANGWRGIWRNGVYDFDHYHSNAHEVLGVERGKAELQLGGPEGRPVTVTAGDAVLLPAGTGHRRIAASSDFVMIGAYPPGQEHYDLFRDLSPGAEQRIAHVPLPGIDPVGGKDGAIMRLWR